MKQGIHPNWHHDCAVTCSCGNTFMIGSVASTLQVDICDKCHPFFTGEMKFVDRQGRVDKFRKKIEAAKTKMAKQPASKKGKVASGNQADPKSYQDILREQKSNLRKKSDPSDQSVQSVQGVAPKSGASAKSAPTAVAQ